MHIMTKIENYAISGHIMYTQLVCDAQHRPMIQDTQKPDTEGSQGWEWSKHDVE